MVVRTLDEGRYQRTQDICNPRSTLANGERVVQLCKKSFVLERSKMFVCMREIQTGPALEKIVVCIGRIQTGPALEN